MKKLLLILCFIFGITISLNAQAVEEKRSVAVFPLNVSVNSSSYAIYSNTQDMFSADLVNSLQQYNDLTTIDVKTSERILKIAGLQGQYEKLVKEYKQRYIIDYEKADAIAQALGVNYIAFINGGFDSERDFLKSNWKYRCQWIWANPVKSSALLTINVTLIDLKNHNYALEETVKKDISMDNFIEPSQSFGENIVPVSQIKKFTQPNALKVAKRIHAVIYPTANEKYSQRDAFIDKFTPNGSIESFQTNANSSYDTNNNSYENYNYPQDNYNTQIDNYNSTQPDNYIENPATNARKESYKKWAESRL